MAIDELHGVKDSLCLVYINLGEYQKALDLYKAEDIENMSTENARNLAKNILSNDNLTLDNKQLIQLLKLLINKIDSSYDISSLLTKIQNYNLIEKNYKNSYKVDVLNDLIKSAYDILMTNFDKELLAMKYLRAYLAYLSLAGVNTSNHKKDLEKVLADYGQYL